MVLDHALRPLFSYLHAVVVPTGVFAASEDFGSTDEGHLDKRVRRAAGELAALLGGDAEPAVPSSSDERRSVEDRFEDPVPFDELLRRASER
jgi:FMN reductase